MTDDQAVKASWCLLEGGLVNEMVWLLREEELPPCVTKMSLVPVKTQIKFLQELRPDIFSLKFTQMAKRQVDWNGKPWILTAFYLATGSKEGDPVICHLEREFIKEMHIRHTAVGRPLDCLVIPGGSGLADFSTCGAYLAINDDVDVTGHNADANWLRHRASRTQVVIRSQGVVGTVGLLGGRLVFRARLSEACFHKPELDNRELNIAFCFAAWSCSALEEHAPCVLSSN